jgi:hypothetical protein
VRHSGHFSIDSENSTPEQGKTTAFVVQKARDLVGQFDQRFRIIRHHRLVAEFSQERCVEFAKHDDVLHNIAGGVYRAHTVARECHFEGERMDVKTTEETLGLQLRLTLERLEAAENKLLELGWVRLNSGGYVSVKELTPTYYVRHPDDSFTVAEPQPVARHEASAVTPPSCICCEDSIMGCVSEAAAPGSTSGPTDQFSKGYKHRNGRPVSDACGDGKHAECTETLDKCNCTVRGGHTTMHAYGGSTSRAKQDTQRGEDETQS